MFQRWGGEDKDRARITPIRAGADFKSKDAKRGRAGEQSRITPLDPRSGSLSRIRTYGRSINSRELYR